MSTKNTTSRTRKRKTVLVTGAAGALAQQVINRLRDKYNIVAVDFRELTYHSDDIPSYKLDFNKRVFEDLFRSYEFDSVIHLGRIYASEETRMRRYNANVLGTQKLLDLSHKYGIGNVIVLSTYHVYGASPYNPALIDERAPLKAAELTMDLVDSVELENLANIYLWQHHHTSAMQHRWPGCKKYHITTAVEPLRAGFARLLPHHAVYPY